MFYGMAVVGIRLLAIYYFLGFVSSGLQYIAFAWDLSGYWTNESEAMVSYGLRNQLLFMAGSLLIAVAVWFAAKPLAKIMTNDLPEPEVTHPVSSDWVIRTGLILSGIALALFSLPKIIAGLPGFFWQTQNIIQGTQNYVRMNILESGFASSSITALTGVTIAVLAYKYMKASSS